MIDYVIIDMKATGANIKRLRQDRGYSVRELQSIFGFKDPQTIYKWQWGKCLPTIDNLVILSNIFKLPLEQILVITKPHSFLHTGHVDTADKCAL